MPKPNPTTELAQRVVETLARLREQGAAVYPPTLPQLVARLDPPPTPELLAKALSKKAFAEKLLRARKKDANSLIALAEDAERLAADPRLLEAVLASLCTAEKPLFPLAKVVGLVEKPLRPAFEIVVRRRIETNDWPAGVGCVSLKGKPHLYLHKFPLPPALAPVLLATKLRNALETSQTDAIGTLRQLAEKVAPGASADDLRLAAAERTFKTRVLLALPNNLASPIGLAEQLPRLAADALVLELALATTRTADNQAVTLADLKKKLDKRLQPAFDGAVTSALASGTLPPTIGCLQIKKKPYLFLRSDVPHGDRSGVERPMEPLAHGRGSELGSSSDLGASIVAAFDRLDREKGGHNLVSLLQLRRALAVDRAVFDAEFQRLRRVGRFTLSAAEGRHGLSVEEREAGIVEEGVLMLYVSQTAR